MIEYFLIFDVFLRKYFWTLAGLSKEHSVIIFIISLIVLLWVFRSVSSFIKAWIGFVPLLPGLLLFGMSLVFAYSYYVLFQCFFSMYQLYGFFILIVGFILNLGFTNRLLAPHHVPADVEYRGNEDAA